MEISYLFQWIDVTSENNRKFIVSSKLKKWCLENKQKWYFIE